MNKKSLFSQEHANTVTAFITIMLRNNVLTKKFGRFIFSLTTVTYMLLDLMVLQSIPGCDAILVSQHVPLNIA